jgi:hypothetical protein
MPAADDFGYIIDRLAGVGPLEQAINIYNEWNGRFVANFFYALFLPSASFLSYQIITASGFALFCISFIIVGTSFKIDLPLYKKLLATLILLMTICISPTYIHDIFFWMGGVANYFIAVIFLTAAYITVVAKPTNIFRRVAQSIVSLILVVLSSICSETFTITALWLSIVVSAALVLKRDRYRAVMTIAFCLILISGLLIMYFSPGTIVRASTVGDSENAGNLIWALWRSLMTTFERGGEWIFISQVIPAALLIDIIFKEVKLPQISDKISLRKQGILLVIFGLTCTWAAHFTISYALGYYGLPSRAKFVAQYFLQIMAVAGFVYIFRSMHLNEKSKTLIVALILFVVLIIPSKHFAPSLMYIGQFSEYYQIHVERRNYIQNSTEDEIVFTATPKRPPIIGYHYYYSKCGETSTIYEKTCVRLDGRSDGYDNYPTLWDLGKR